MSSILALRIPSLSAALSRVSPAFEKLKSLLPGLEAAVSRLESVEAKFCRPLLSLEPEELRPYISRNLASFTYYLVYALEPISSSLLLGEGIGRLKELGRLEAEAFGDVKRLVEERAKEKGVDAGPVVKAHAAAVDYDLWLIGSVLEVGLEGLIGGLAERAGEEVEGMVRSLYSLFYALMAVDSALFKDAPYRRESLGELVALCSTYAEEVEDYLDTLSLLVSDEAYEACRRFAEG